MRKDTSLSWSNIITFICAVIFSAASIGYLYKTNFAELPGSYQLIITSVFLSYFTKSAIEKILTKNSPVKSNDL